MYRIESPECPQRLIVSMRRNSFIAGLLIGAALTFGAFHVPWPKPTGPIGDPEVPSTPSLPGDPPKPIWSRGPLPLPTKEGDKTEEKPFPLPTKPIKAAPPPADGPVPPEEKR